MEITLENIEEIERLIKIGKATEFAMQNGSYITAFAYGIERLLEFYDRES